MKTILVIEDESSIAELIAAILEDAGYRVLVATHGQEGMDILALERPDLILSDVMMPRMDGRALVRAVRANPSYQAIPIILMSAGVDRVAELDGLIIGFLPKPFPIDYLLDKVEATLG